VVENDAKWAYEVCRDYDRKTKDPFDLYLEIKEREKPGGRRSCLPAPSILFSGTYFRQSRRLISSFGICLHLPTITRMFLAGPAQNGGQALAMTVLQN